MLAATALFLLGAALLLAAAPEPVAGIGREAKAVAALVEQAAQNDPPETFAKRLGEIAAAFKIQLVAQDAAGAVVAEAGQANPTLESIRPLAASGAQTMKTPLPGGKEGLLRIEASFFEPTTAAGFGSRAALIHLSAGVCALVVLGARIRRDARLLAETDRMAKAVAEGDLAVRINPGRLDPHGKPARRLTEMSRAVHDRVLTLNERITRLEAVFDAIADGAMTLDRNGRIKACNRALVGWFPEAATAVGKNPLEVVFSPELQRAAEAALNEKKPAAETKRLTIAVGERVFEAGLTRLVNGDPNALAGLVVVLHDVSARTRLETMRKDFIANVSHELRTPLTSVKGWAETLLIGLDAGRCEKNEVRNALDVIVRQADFMAKIVGELLHLAALESGKQTFAVTPVRPAEAVRAALAACPPPAPDQAPLVLDQIPDDAPNVAVDQQALVQILRNLIENALKYGDPSPEKPVRIAGEVIDKQYRFVVEDAGPGVPPEEHDRIFARFHRLSDRGRTRNKGDDSTGLGLAIAARLAEGMRCSLRVQSPVSNGRGAAFLVDAPLA